jgi:hypothetical protein
MSDTKYTMQYDAEGKASQYDAPVWQTRRPNTVLIDSEPRRRFRIPSILKTASMFVLGALSLAAMEKYAPENWRPSTIVGTYDARIASTVKSAELNQQAKFETWAAQVKIATEQNAENYRAGMKVMQDNYAASYELAKVYAQSAAQMQGRFMEARLQQVNAQTGAETSIINMTKMVGLGLQAIGEEKGDALIAYSDAMARDVADRMTKAAMEGARVDITGWDANLPSPQTVRADIERFAPTPVPPPPVWGEQPASLASQN